MTTAPLFVQARQQALRACTLGAAQGCFTASSFFRLGTGGAQELSESARLEALGTSLQR